MLRLAAAVAVVCATAAVHAAAPSYDVSVRVDSEARHLDGHARIVVAQRHRRAASPSCGCGAFPSASPRARRALNDYNFYWVYPYRFNPGHMRTGAVARRRARRRGRGARSSARGQGHAAPRRARPAAPPARRATVDVDFSVDVPTRYGAVRLRARRLHAQRLLSDGRAARRRRRALDAMPGRGRIASASPCTTSPTSWSTAQLRALERGRRLDFDVGEAEGLTLMVGRPQLGEFERTEHGVRIVLPVADGARAAVAARARVAVPAGQSRRPRARDRRRGRRAARSSWACRCPPAKRCASSPARCASSWRRRCPASSSCPTRSSTSSRCSASSSSTSSSWRARSTRAGSRGARSPRERADDLGWAPDAAPRTSSTSTRCARIARRSSRARSWRGPASSRRSIASCTRRRCRSPRRTSTALEDPDPLRDNLRSSTTTRPTGKTIYTKLRDLLGTRRST